MIARMFLLFCFVTAMGCKGKTMLEHEEEAVELKVMSYNIHIGNPPSKEAGYVDLSALANVINNEKPALVALQEVDANTKRSGVNSHQAADLAKLTGMDYFFAKAIDYSGGEYGVAVLSRYPILESTAIRLPLPIDHTGGEDRSAAVIKVNVNNKEIIFVSTHLDHKSDENRAYQAQQLLEHLKKYQTYPVFIGGDLNMTPFNAVMGVFKSEFAVRTTGPFTFSAVNPTTTIDYILLSKRASEVFNIKRYRAINEKYASDHLPLVADITFK